jgi:hypothetical protein
MREEDAIVHGIAISRKKFIELVVIAILLSLGVNLIAGQMLSWFSAEPLITLLLGTLLCLFAISYLTFSLFGKRTKETSIEAFFAYNPLKKEPVVVPRYEFSGDICRFIKAAFAENPALKIRWEKQPLKPYKYLVRCEDGSSFELSHDELSKLRLVFEGTEDSLMPPDGQIGINFPPITPKENYTVELIVEAMEYFILEELSSHLCYYFSDEKFDEKNLTQYTRSGIPSVLLTNSFLELFTRPKAERLAFVDRTEDKDTLTVSLEHGGSRYYNFCLILPKGSTVARPSDHKITIETKKLKISFAVRFEGAMAPIDNSFQHYYMAYPNMFDLAIYKVWLDIRISVKWRALLSGNGWEYYKWVDSFLNKLEKSVSREVFFKKIDWESTLTLLKCSNFAPHILTPQQHNQEDLNVLS